MCAYSYSGFVLTTLVQTTYACNTMNAKEKKRKRARRKLQNNFHLIMWQTTPETLFMVPLKLHVGICQPRFFECLYSYLLGPQQAPPALASFCESQLRNPTPLCVLPHAAKGLPNGWMTTNQVKQKAPHWQSAVLLPCALGNIILQGLFGSPKCLGCLYYPSASKASATWLQHMPLKFSVAAFRCILHCHFALLKELLWGNSAFFLVHRICIAKALLDLFWQGNMKDNESEPHWWKFAYQP